MDMKLCSGMFYILEDLLLNELEILKVKMLDD